MYIEKKKANIITTEMEDKLWEQGLLGNNSPHQICMLVFMIGFCLALTSGEKHKRLCHKPS